MARWLKAAVPAALVFGVASVAMAQGGAPTGRGMWGDGPGWGMGPGWHMGWGRRGGQASDWMLERIEGRLAFIKAELKITETQTGAWNELADALRAAAKHHNERMRSIFANGERHKTLPERVEAQEQFMAARTEEIRLIKTAVKNLYAVLSEAQKKDADEMEIPMIGMMGRSWG